MRHLFMRHFFYPKRYRYVFAFADGLLTYIFYFAIQFTVKRIDFLFVLSIPIITCIATFCIGLFFLLLVKSRGGSSYEIPTFGFLYGLINLLAANRFWRQKWSVCSIKLIKKLIREMTLDWKGHAYNFPLTLI